MEEHDHATHEHSKQDTEDQVDRVFGKPQVSIFAETTMRVLFRNEEHGRAEANRGGTTIFVAPGIRADFSPNMALTVSPQFPISQQFIGKQLKTRAKVLVAFSIKF